MLAVGRALMTNPRLLMLDEAAEGLAPRVRQTIWNCISALAFSETGDPDHRSQSGETRRIADRQYILEKGKSPDQGQPPTSCERQNAGTYLKVSGAGATAA